MSSTESCHRAYLSGKQIKDKNIVISLYLKQTKTPPLHHTVAVFMFTLFIKIPVSKGKQIDRKMDVGIVYSSLSV